jgi:hypothetical protein
MRETINNPPKSVGWEDGKGRFLIDGFPRKMDQAIEFDRSVSSNSSCCSSLARRRIRRELFWLGVPKRKELTVLTSCGIDMRIDLCPVLLVYRRGHARATDGPGQDERSGGR